MQQPLTVFQDFLKEREVEYKECVPFCELSYVKLGGTAALAVYPKTEAELIATVLYAEEYGIKYKVVGRMSNVLPPDGFYGGMILKTDKISEIDRKGNSVFVRCGRTLPSLAAFLADAHLSGLEPLSGIPASIGGAVYMNAGAYGSEISDFIKSVRVLDKKSGSICVLNKDEIKFSYRHSDIADKGFLILSAELYFLPSSAASIKESMSFYARKRRQSQPISLPSLGSVFKRCGEVSAAKLIDEAGLKGYRFGGASISEKHAGFIVNNSGATAAEYLYLVELAKKFVFSKYGIILKEEIELLQ